MLRVVTPASTGKHKRASIARDRVFISYSHKDARWLKRLQVHFSPFERAGKLQRWDDTMIKPGTRWREEIAIALASARVAVLLVSPDFLASSFILDEELPRLLSAAENDGVVIVPVILSPCAFNRVETLAQFQSLNPPSQPLNGLAKAKRERLLVKLAELIESLLESQPRAGEEPGPAAGRLCGVPARNPLFCGRDPLLDQLSDLINAGRSAALCGLAGMGKTETAIEYVYRNRQRYSLVAWIRADTRAQIHASLVAVARFVELPESSHSDQTVIVAAVLRWLGRNTGWLTIFDDVEDLDVVKEFLPDVGNGYLILTTRMQATTAIAVPLDVEPLGLDDAAGLLLRRGRIVDGEAGGITVDSDHAAARRIADEMGCSPLALDQAGAFLEETGCGIDAYLALWSTNRPRLLAQAPSSSLRSTESVAATCSLAFGEVEKSKPQAIELLRLLAFLHPDAIPEDVLSAGSELLGPSLAPVVADPWQLNEAIREAIKFSLLRRDAKSRVLRMHRLFQAVMRDAMERTAQATWAERAVRAIERGFPEAKFVNWERCERLVAHAQVCAKHIEEWQLRSPSAGRLLHELGYYLFQRGRYREAAGFVESALALRREICGAAHPDCARTLDVRGQLLQVRGELAEAEASYREAITALAQSVGTEHDETARVIGHLAALELERRRFTDARELFVKALAITERSLGGEDPRVAQLVNNLAALCFQQGDYREAEQMFRRALAIREKILPAGHPSIAQTLNNLAAACSRQARRADAAALYRRALEIRESSLGPAHPDVAETLCNLALLDVDEGGYEAAETSLQRALAIREAAHGSHHPSTASVLAILGRLRRLQGKLEESESLHQRALRIRQTAFGNDHPSVGHTLRELGETIRARGDDEKAQTLLRQALEVLEKGLGPRHPDVTDCRARISAEPSVTKVEKRALSRT